MAENQIQYPQKEIMINMWLSKTFLKNACETYREQLNSSILEMAREALVNVKEVRRVYEWRHYCGEKPRYWYIKIKEDGTVSFEGGTVWRAMIKDNTLYTDGCVTKALLMGVIDEGIRHATSLKCGSMR